MKKPVILAILFLIFSYGLALSSYYYNRSHTSDSKTVEAINEADGKVQNYVDSHNALPASIDLSNNQTKVTYKKYSGSFYMLCANFNYGQKGTTDRSTYIDSQEQAEANPTLESLKQQDPSTKYIYASYAGYIYDLPFDTGHNCFVMRVNLSNVDYNSSPSRDGIQN